MLNNLLTSLSKRDSSDIIFNQYQDEDIRNNLRLYFDYLLQNKHDVLLIGEAPGYNGCRLTGIPFTSGAVIKKSEHKIFKKIGSEIVLHQVVSENTATILWDFLGSNRLVPILWNAFPFHPNKSRIPKSNRRPNVLEIEEGKKYLRIVYDLFKPKKLCSLGQVGEKVLKELFPNEKIIYIRHPSRGGKKDFIEGMLKLYDSHIA
ncbi:MAG: uracil-DNA glycosylase [Methanosarcinales archaeon Met12]|nr:MAG: uracil-DNA glycosylase [Methanosarcinales archaeon Met12]